MRRPANGGPSRLMEMKPILQLHQAARLSVDCEKSRANV